MSKFSTRDLVIMAILIAISGVFQVVWAQFVFNVNLLGPFSAIFSNVGFVVWGFIAIYLVPKSGSATIVKGIGAIIEVLLGNPVGPVAIAYGTLEGLAVDVAFVLFRRKLTVEMMIIGALLSQLFTAPIDFVRDAVPFEFLAMAAYWAPGVAGTVLTGWLSSLVLRAMQRIGAKGALTVT
jgi:ABC-type thiamin/hydroxymethylpyrimidine transport system permease subunit